MTNLLDRPATLARAYTIGFAALALLITTVALGVYLGTQTRQQFKEVEASWVFHQSEVNQKGIWISSIRGYLGYGGIIHSFKNYVLRGEPHYLERTRSQIEQFNGVVKAYLESPASAPERKALNDIKNTIDAYAARLPIVKRSVDEGLAISEIDRLVKLDDTAAIQGLATLEQLWQQFQKASSARVFAAVNQGQRLIWIGFASIAALVLAALIIGFLLVLLLRDLRAAIHQLSDELHTRRSLEQSEGRLARAVEQSPATIFITDTDAHILYVNERFKQITGWSGQEVEGKTPKFLQSGDTAPEVYDEIKTALAAGQEWRGIFRNKKKSGESYWVESSILPLIGPDGTIQNFIGIGEDITEKREAREQIVRAQKLEAVGLIAGGIAHDFNNILTTIIGAAHLAKMETEPESELEMEVDQINIAALRAQSLVRGLLTFARREPGKAEPVDLHDVVSETTHLLKASIPPVIDLIYTAEPEKFIVLADHNQLHQIIMNLGRNAAEAIGNSKGRISFQCVHLDNEPAGLAPRAAGWHQLIISDDGPGMSPTTLEKLYDPFFSTKPLGKGSGLGMAVVSSLVEEMGGQISVESALGKGTTFFVTLPRADEAVVKNRSLSTELPTGHETIILIDDQPEVASILRRVIMRLGYSVDAFTSALTALEQVQKDPKRYDLMITDLVMPGLDGEQLTNHIRAIRPDMPVIICTVHNPKKIDVKGDAPVVLNKPIEPNSIAKTIRAVLDISQ